MLVAAVGHRAVEQVGNLGQLGFDPAVQLGQAFALGRDPGIEGGDPRAQLGRGGLLVGGLGDPGAQPVLLGLERLDRGQRGPALAVEREDAVGELGSAASPAGRGADVIGLAAQQFDTQHDLPPLREPRTASYRMRIARAARPCDGLGRAGVEAG